MLQNFQNIKHFEYRFRKIKEIINILQRFQNIYFKAYKILYIIYLGFKK